MKQRHNPAPNCLHQTWQRTLPAQSLCLVGSISLLNGGFVLAQTEAIDNIVPVAENSQPVGNIVIKKETVNRVRTTTVPEATSSQPEFSQRRTKLQQRLNQANTNQPTQAPKQQPVVRIRTQKPDVAVSQPPAKKVTNTPAISREEKPKLELAAPVTPRSPIKKLPTVAQPSTNSPSIGTSTPVKSRDFNNAYIDPTDYSAKATPNYEAPSSVVLTERSSGCQATIRQGQGINGSICAKVPIANAKKTTPTWLNKSQNAQLAAITPANRVNANTTNPGWRPPGIVSKVIPNRSNSRQLRSNNIASASVSKSAYQANRFIPSPSSFTPTTTVSNVPIAPSAGTLSAPMTAANTAPRPSTVAYDIPLATTLPRIAFRNIYGGAVAYNMNGFIFLLSVPASITSVFGWRTHPITGDRRFHAGTDIGAATGTPIVAAYAGQVEVANWKGGYGLTVVVNHNNAQQTLYAHMSEIFVQPGQWVEQGTVIGRVGSTGNSTGPHLHFEVRQLTPQGWVAVDSGLQLQIALNQLMQTLQTAQVATKNSGS